jgi:hypothetical protein
MLSVLPCLPSLALVGGIDAEFLVLALPLTGNLSADETANQSVVITREMSEKAGNNSSSNKVRISSGRVGLAASLDGSFVLVADSGNQVLLRLGMAAGVVTTLAGLAGATGSADGAGSVARFYLPVGVAVSPDGAFALVADSGGRLSELIA